MVPDQTGTKDFSDNVVLKHMGVKNDVSCFFCKKQNKKQNEMLLSISFGDANM